MLSFHLSRQYILVDSHCVLFVGFGVEVCTRYFNLDKIESILQQWQGLWFLYLYLI